jgi:hypothetical protein
LFYFLRDSSHLPLQNRRVLIYPLPNLKKNKQTLQNEDSLIYPLPDTDKCASDCIKMLMWNGTRENNLNYIKILIPYNLITYIIINF